MALSLACSQPSSSSDIPLSESGDSPELAYLESSSDQTDPSLSWTINEESSCISRCFTPLFLYSVYARLLLTLRIKYPSRAYALVPMSVVQCASRLSRSTRGGARGTRNCSVVSVMAVIYGSGSRVTFAGINRLALHRGLLKQNARRADRAPMSDE